MVRFKSGSWRGRGETSVSIDNLKKIGLSITKIPHGYQLNKKLIRIIEQRRKNIQRRT